VEIGGRLWKLDNGKSFIHRRKWKAAESYGKQNLEPVTDQQYSGKA